jgi:hypothetical protein
MSATAVRAPRGVWADLADGVRLVLGSRRLVGVIVAATVVMLGLGAVNVLLVPFVVEVLDASETWFGALEAAQVASMVLAGGALVVVGARFRPTTLISAGLAASDWSSRLWRRRRGHGTSWACCSRWAGASRRYRPPSQRSSRAPPSRLRRCSAPSQNRSTNGRSRTSVHPAR